MSKSLREKFDDLFRQSHINALVTVSALGHFVDLIDSHLESLTGQAATPEVEKPRASSDQGHDDLGWNVPTPETEKLPGEPIAHPSAVEFDEAAELLTHSRWWLENLGRRDAPMVISQRAWLARAKLATFRPAPVAPTWEAVRDWLRSKGWSDDDSGTNDALSIIAHFGPDPERERLRDAVIDEARASDLNGNIGLVRALNALTAYEAGKS